MLRRPLIWLFALTVFALGAAVTAAPAGDPRPEGDDEEAPAEARPETTPDKKPAKKVEEVAEDPLADVKAVASAAFKACLDPSESAGFNRYMDLIHPDQKDAGHSEDQIRRYSWKKFRGGCGQWLKDRKRLEFVVARTDPSKVTKETDAVKVFFKAQHKPEGGGPLRWDAPMEFRKHGDRWMIWRNSL